MKVKSAEGPRMTFLPDRAFTPGLDGGSLSKRCRPDFDGELVKVSGSLHTFTCLVPTLG